MSLRDDVARALCALKVSQTSEDWQRYRQPDSWMLFTDEADAILPLVIERCARVAMASPDSHWGPTIAAAIRNLGGEA